MNGQMPWPSWEESPPLYTRATRQPQVLLTPVAALLPGDLRQSPPVDSASAMKFGIEMTPTDCEADLGFAQATPAARGGGYSPLPSGSRSLSQAMDFFTPTGAIGDSRVPGPPLIDRA